MHRVCESRAFFGLLRITVPDVGPERRHGLGARHSVQRLGTYSRVATVPGADRAIATLAA